MVRVVRLNERFDSCQVNQPWHTTYLTGAVWAPDAD
jgi:hypothetical protein